MNIFTHFAVGPICRTDLTLKNLTFIGKEAGGENDGSGSAGGGGGAAAKKAKLADTSSSSTGGGSGGGGSAGAGAGAGAGAAEGAGAGAGSSGASATSFEAKLNVLLADLSAIRKKDVKAKVLIFSQFGETLKRLKTGLTDRGYQYRTLTGGMTRSQRTKALSDFQKDPPTTVFLLSTRAGAVGINLTQANHIFLMEPSFNEALEKQAIGRVYRMGQTRKVSVTRYIIAQSIEENMLKTRKKRAEGDGMVGIGSIRGEGKAEASSMDFNVLFGTADQMPVAGDGEGPEVLVDGEDGKEEDDDEDDDADTDLIEDPLPSDSDDDGDGASAGGGGGGGAASAGGGAAAGKRRFVPFPFRV